MVDSVLPADSSVDSAPTEDSSLPSDSDTTDTATDSVPPGDSSPPHDSATDTDALPTVAECFEDLDPVVDYSSVGLTMGSRFK